MKGGTRILRVSHGRDARAAQTNNLHYLRKFALPVAFIHWLFD